MKAALFALSLVALSSTLSTGALAANPVVCDVKAYGAQGNGTDKDTQAIQAAIDHCARQGGGTVRLHDGIYLSGMIRLQSHITLHIESTATLKGTQDDSDYPDLYPHTDNTQLNNCRKALIYAEGATDLTITGYGTIDGNGDKKEWIGNNVESPEKIRPMPIFIVQSNHVLIEGLHVNHAAMWSVVNMETDDLTVRGLKIHSTFFGNRDGIDVVDCHRVLIENNTIYSEDDSICLKSGTARGTEDVMVRNNTILRSIVANGLKLGTASTGSFKNITFDHNTVQNVAKAVMTVEAIDGAQVSDIVFKDITFKNSGTPFFVLLGRRKSGQKDGDATPRPVGSIDGVHFENIQGDAMIETWGSPVSGSIVDGVRYAIQNLSFKNVNVTYLGGLGTRPATPPEYAGQYPDPNIWKNLPAYGIFFRHVDGLEMTNVNLKVAPNDARPSIDQVDVK